MSNNQSLQYFQQTVAAPIHFVGRGLHSGKSASMTLMPADADTGYIFRRLDIEAPHNEVAGRWHNVTDTHLCTTIRNSVGVSVKTIEHLVAALSACGVDNCRIDIDGPEVPIMDGSSRPFVEQIEANGVTVLDKERLAIVVTEPVWVTEGEAKAGLHPFPEPWVDMTIDFESSVIGKQRLAVPITQQHFNKYICAARTFGFSEQVETLKKLGFAKGGSLRNAILINHEEVINPEGLRYENEFVRHKVVDAIGDLALIGVKIVGCFQGYCSGHELNNRLLRSLMLQKDKWTYTTMRDAMENWEHLMIDRGQSSYKLDQIAQFAD